MHGNDYTKDVDGEPMLLPYSYKKTLLGLGGHSGEMTALWVEGLEMEKPIKPSGFGYAGHPMWTNSGLYLKREQLQELVKQMPPKSELCFAAMTYPSNSTEDKIKAEFDKDNDKILVYRNRIANRKTLEQYPIKDEEREWMERNKHLLEIKPEKDDGVRYIPVQMAIMSHLSDAQESLTISPFLKHLQTKINFAKRLVLTYPDTSIEVSENELNELWKKTTERP